MPREWILTPEERSQIAVERMSLGSIKGRVRSAAPVRPKPAALVPRLAVRTGAVLHDFFLDNPTLPSATNTRLDWVLYGALNDGITEQSDPTQPTVLADGVYMIICTLQLDPNYVEAESTFAEIVPAAPYGSSLFFAHNAGGTALTHEPAGTAIGVRRMSAGDSFRLDANQTAAADRSYRFSAEVVKLS